LVVGSVRCVRDRFIGNHDIWIFDYLPSELGIEVIDGYLVEEIDGRKFFMTHGDGVGKLKPTFKIIRSLFRSRICQKLFAGIHPRWTVPFAYRWSDHSRHASPLPSESDARRMIENITAFSREYLNEHPDINYFLYGHLHLLERFEIEVPNTRKSGGSAEIIVLGEWLSQFSYAYWDGDKLEIKKYKEK
ncbi:MAG: hypothetical protein K2G23_08470, partial [Muribaculaceae bacterium]|nr:hypothetical protein [Muribaculaceae bacterium]